jgi:hypothetical protein
MDEARSFADSEIITALSTFAVIAIGFIVARYAQRGVAHGLAALDARLSRYSTGDRGLISPASTAVVKGATFWFVVLLAVVIALRMLGVGGFSTVLERIVDFIPRILTAAVIVGASHLLGLVARGLVARAGGDMHPDDLAPRVVHVVVLVAGVLIALQQMRIDISFITQLVISVLVVFLGGLTLAFALGAREHVANLLGRSEIDRYAVGDRIRIDDVEGLIVHVHNTGVDIATEQGVVSVPASRFSVSSVLRLPEEGDAGR